MNRTKYIQWRLVRWFLLASISLFFFLRGIHLILTGGGWIATTDQPAHWILLFLEIIIAFFAAFGSFYVWFKESYVLNKKLLKRSMFNRTILFAIIFTFAIHFIRVGFWIQNSVL
jgi:hypothetical protein